MRTVVNMRWVKPLDVELLLEVAASHEALVTLEEGAIMGGAGGAVGEALQSAGDAVAPSCISGFQTSSSSMATRRNLLALQGLDAAGIEASRRSAFCGDHRSWASGAEGRCLNSCKRQPLAVGT
jgi:1-deoxy-D-xylulose-5-phosphate synthase